MTDFIATYPNAVPDELTDWLISFIDRTYYYKQEGGNKKEAGSWVDQSSYNNDGPLALDNREPHRSDRQVIMEGFAPGEANKLLEYIGGCLGRYITEVVPSLTNFGFTSGLTLLQKTCPMQGYHNFHCEDTSYNTSGRTLTWMVYLNTVERGETEWLYQRKRVSPQKGMVVLWPGSFTHLHRGNPPMSDKYVATGWFQADNGSLNEHTLRKKG